jgi:hypothetical protein
MRTKEEKLAALYNRHTLYEVAAVNSVTGDKVLVMYSARSRTRMVQCLLKDVRDGKTRLDLLAERTNTPPDDWRYSKPPVVAECGDWHVQLTGRTQREAIIEGELPSIYRPQPMEVAA